MSGCLRLIVYPFVVLAMVFVFSMFDGCRSYQEDPPEETTLIWQVCKDSLGNYRYVGYEEIPLSEVKVYRPDCANLDIRTR